MRYGGAYHSASSGNGSTRLAQNRPASLTITRHPGIAAEGTVALPSLTDRSSFAIRTRPDVASAGRVRPS
ncbi:hypothetical protein GCM10017673_13740 [Streptosporangium violaceochromogenes]|nr:hypothetical protein GCM10017673_13740 [Streptosporangium violaceochromogenes]